MNLKTISSKTITSKLPILIGTVLSLVVIACAIVLIHKSPMPAGSGNAASMPASSQLVAYGNQATETGEPGWPRTITSGDTTILFYPPQIETWDGDQIQAYAALSVQSGQSDQQTYGKVYFTTHAVTDKANRQVTLDRFKVTKGDFPSAPDKTNDYLAIIQQAEGNRTETVPQDELLSNLAASQAEHKSGYEIKNDPPRIIFTTKPAVLVLIDGQPALRSAGEGGLQRVINTRALILFDQPSGTYYLSLMNGWVQTTNVVEGPWTFARDVPPAADKVKRELASSGQIDLLNGEEASQGDRVGHVRKARYSSTSRHIESLSQSLRNGTFPTVYVSTVPAELLTAQGDPQLKPIPNTNLMYVSNSSDQILLNAATRDYYVLISGRWFSAKSLDGPWHYVAGKDLPPDFAKIPEGDPKASVLASTPGTVAAREAAIANEVPQTATVNRHEAELTVTYDGDPRFESIPGTRLECAVNSAIPVIEVSSNDFLAVQNGVWFTSTSAMGPWVVATSVPPEVYSIPTRHRLHNVTYVRTYGYNDDYVYEGYTPGYYGTLLAPDDELVVYGSGFSYPPYIGSSWFGWPWTYGFGAGFYWAPTVGWGFGFGEGFLNPFFSPWWTPFGFGFGFPEVAFASPGFGFGFGFVPVFNVFSGFPLTTFAFSPGFGFRPVFASGFAFPSRFGVVGTGFNVFGRWGGAALVGTRTAWSGARITTANTRTGTMASAAGGRFANSGGVAGNRFGGPMANSMTGAGSRASAAASRAAVGAMAGARMNGRGAAAGTRTNGLAASRAAMAGSRANMGSRGAFAGSRANMGSRGAFGASRATTMGGGRFAASRGAMSAPRMRGGFSGSRGGFAASRGAMSAPQMRGGFGGSRGGGMVMRGGGGAGRGGSFAAPRAGGFGGGGARMGGGGFGGGARMSAGGGGRGGRR